MTPGEPAGPDPDVKGRTVRDAPVVDGGGRGDTVTKRQVSIRRRLTPPREQELP
jgi:hypothetical protein